MCLFNSIRAEDAAIKPFQECLLVRLPVKPGAMPSDEGCTISSPNALISKLLIVGPRSTLDTRLDELGLPARGRKREERR